MVVCESRSRDWPGSRIAKLAVDALVEAGVDLLVLDTAHGHHSRGVIEAARAHEEGATANDTAGGGQRGHWGCHQDAHRSGSLMRVKVGIGPGQRFAPRASLPVLEYHKSPPSPIASKSAERDPHDVPIIADGGIKYSGDVTKAIAAGASTR